MVTIFQFPEEDVGELWDKRYGNQSTVAEARGQVRIEGRHKLILQITALSHGQLGFLRDLPAYSLHGVHCGYNPLYKTDQDALLSLRWLRFVGLWCEGASEDVLPSLVRDFPNLRVLFYGGTLVSDLALRDAPRSDSIRYLGNLPGQRTDITDSGVVSIGVKMPRLLGLELAYSRTTDESTWAIARLPLRHLSVTKTSIGDSGVARMGDMQSLRNLGLSQTQVSDAAAYFLRRLPRIQTLMLNGTNVGDDSVEYLAGTRSLRMLGLTQTRITKNALRWFEQMTQLRTLMLGSQLDADSLASLRQSLPNCRVV